MKRFAALLLVGALFACYSNDANAQAYVTYYQPATVYYAPPAVPAPVAYTVASPVVVETPPVVAAPQPVVTYYRAPTVVYQPVAQVHTRYRPILGGTVSRVTYRYAPVVVP